MRKKAFWGIASSYGGEKTENLLFFSADDKGIMREEGRFQIGENPSFLCRAGNILYVGLEKPDEAVILSYRVVFNGGIRMEQTGRLRTEGSGLCHLWAGKEAVYGSCYGSGHVFAIDRTLSRVLWKICPDREPGFTPHAHCSVEAMGGTWLVETDLGMDVVYGFPLQHGNIAGDRVTLADFSGMGPRQVLYEKHTRQFLVVGERGNTVSGFEWIDGQTSVSNAWIQKWSISATKISGINYPGGACLTENGLIFWGNRNADTIAAAKTGTGAQFLGEWPCKGSWPRSVFAADRHVFAACQKSGTIESFIWDGGRLTYADRLDLNGAACVMEWGF